MARLPICPICEKEVTLAQPYKEFNKKKYHMACYRKMQQDKFNVTYEKEVVKKEVKDELFDYIKNIFKVEEIDGLILKQIENFATEYKLDYKQIYDILFYFFSIKGNTTEGIRGIGIVPYVMSEAREFYKMKEEANELLRDKDVKIRKETVKVKNKNDIKIPLIDINNL